MAFDLKNIDFKSIDFRTIYEWPIYGRLVIFSLVAALIFILAIYFDFSRLSGQIFLRYKDEQDLKQQVKAILKTEEEMKEIVLQYPKIMKLLNQWQGQLIKGRDLPDLLNQILKIGAVDHLRFSLFALGKKKKEDDYYLLPISIITEGGYIDVGQFLSQVANLPQIISIGDFTMIMLKKESKETATESGTVGAGTGAYLTTALALEVYYLANNE